MRKEASLVANTLRAYYSQTDVIPDNSWLLDYKKQITREDYSDPWSEPYYVTVSNTTLNIWSFGEDGLRGGDDNITFEFLWLPPDY